MAEDLGPQASGYSVTYSQGQLDRLNANLVDTWKVYMTWFTFFFTANLLVMSWVLTDTRANTDSGSVWLLALFWIVFNMTGAITSFGLALYSYRCCSRMQKLLATLTQGKDIVDTKLTFPRALSVMGACFNGTALIGNIAVWAYIWASFS